MAKDEIDAFERSGPIDLFKDVEGGNIITFGFCGILEINPA